MEEERATVDEDDMLQVVADWTGIPLNRMEAKESKKLLKLEEDLREHIIGQDFATEVVAKALRRSRADLKDPNAQLVLLCFLGQLVLGKHILRKFWRKEFLVIKTHSFKLICLSTWRNMPFLT